MFRYGLPLIAALALTFAVVKIVQSRPVHARLMPPASPPSAAFPNQVGAVGLVEAASGAGDRRGRAGRRACEKGRPAFFARQP